MFKKYIVELRSWAGSALSEERKPWAKPWHETNPIENPTDSQKIFRGDLHPNLPDHHPVQALALARLANEPHHLVSPHEPLLPDEDLDDAEEAHTRAARLHYRAHRANQSAAQGLAQSNPEQSAIHAKLARHSAKAADLHVAKLGEIEHARREAEDDGRYDDDGTGRPAPRRPRDTFGREDD